jgi:hypothetical protein
MTRVYGPDAPRGAGRRDRPPKLWREYDHAGRARESRDRGGDDHGGCH